MRRNRPALTGYYLVIQAYGFVVFLVISLLLAYSARAEENPSLFVKRLADQATVVLTDPSLSEADRRLAFEQMLDVHLDVATIGRLVLGRHWRGASSAERRAYLELFEAFVVATYVRWLESYAGETLEVGRAQDKGRKGVLVPSRLHRPAGAPLAVTWRLRQADGRWRVVDLVVEGVSLVVTHRTEFDSVIRQGDGSLEPLLANLRAMLARLGSRGTAKLRTAPSG